jgi:DUF438 domain-containing protein
VRGIVRAGTQRLAEFWIELGGRFIHIRYFAVRDKENNYRGCLEVSQDVTGIRALEGERRGHLSDSKSARSAQSRAFSL